MHCYGNWKDRKELFIENVLSKHIYDTVDIFDFFSADWLFLEEKNKSIILLLLCSLVLWWIKLFHFLNELPFISCEFNLVGLLHFIRRKLYEPKLAIKEIKMFHFNVIMSYNFSGSANKLGELGIRVKPHQYLSCVLCSGLFIVCVILL